MNAAVWPNSTQEYYHSFEAPASSGTAFLSHAVGWRETTPKTHEHRYGNKQHMSINTVLKPGKSSFNLRICISWLLDPLLVSHTESKDVGLPKVQF